MSVFSAPSFREHEQVVFRADAEVGLKAIIAIHDTTLGPALGGLRMWDYADDAAALEDALRLSRGMTYKAAMAGLPYGGGKAVIIGDSRRDKSEALLARFGDFVDALAGRYITAEDVGISTADLAVIRRRTRHAAGYADGGSGDPSPVTAWGVFHGIRAGLAHRLGSDDLADRIVSVQGLGHVGQYLVRFLAEAGAKIVVADIDEARVADMVANHGVTAVAPEAIYDVHADVFAPCALGAVLNDETIARLDVRIVAGAANNQLARDEHGEVLRARGILYAPDYVINAGGIININYEGPNYDAEAAFAHAARIGETATEVFRAAQRADAATNLVADGLAEAKIAAARGRAREKKLRLAS